MLTLKLAFVRALLDKDDEPLWMWVRVVLRYIELFSEEIDPSITAAMANVIIRPMGSVKC